MKYKKLAEKITELSGGKENLRTIANCMTRVRLTFVDDTKVDKKGIQDLEGVLGIHEADSFQIIVGPGKSAKVKDEIDIIVGGAGVEDVEMTESSGILKIITSIFVPLIPAIIASGIVQGVNNLLVNNAANFAANNGIQSTDALSAAQVVLSQWHLLQVSTILGALGAATFGYLAIYTGIMAAKVFRTDQMLGGLLGAATIFPGLGAIGITAGSGGLFGIIFAVWALSYVHRALRKVIPDILDVVFTPTLSVLIVGAGYILLCMPIFGWLSDQLLDGIMFLLEKTGPFGGFIMSFSAPFLIATGLHHGLTAIHMEFINATGATPIFPLVTMSNPGLVGAGIAIAFLTKSKSVKEIARGCIPTTILAVGEPTMYGLVIPSGFGLFTAAIGAGVGGFFIRLFDVQTTAIGAAGISAIPLIADGKYLQYLISYVAGCAIAFIVTLVVGKARKYE